MNIHDQFKEIIDPRWQITEQGNGGVVRRQGALHLTLPPSDDLTYHNAQITEYKPTEKQFQFKPPLKMTVNAYSSLHPANMKGTAGFGFWNHPFSPDTKGFGLPQNIWFFFSSAPSNITIADGVAGNGWKVATLNTGNLLARVLLPLAPVGILLMRSAFFYKRLWGFAQRALGIHEVVLDRELLTSEHAYTLEWRADGAIFSVDGDVVMKTNQAPRGALGFIAWMDNQYAVVTPQGTLNMGLTSIDKMQALVLRSIEIESLSD